MHVVFIKNFLMATESTNLAEQKLRQKLTRFLSESDTKKGGSPDAASRLEVLAVLRLIQDAGFPAFLFGGLLRHLMVESRSTPLRDVDVVVDCARTEDL